VRGFSPGESAKITVLRDGKKKSFDVEMGERESRKVIVDIDKNFRGPHGRSHFDSGDIDIQVFSDGDHETIWFGDDSVMESDRGFMGVHLDDLTEQLGEYFGAKGGQGALVTEVTQDSPAEKAGLVAGDVIVKIDDEDIESSMAIHKALAGSEPEQKVKVTALRNGKSKKFEVTLAEVPDGAGTKKVMKRIEIMGDGEDLDLRSDRTFMFRGNGGRHGRFQHDDDSGANVEIIHLGTEEDGALEELREELDQLREELDELREELKK
jgi:C-terminal processing protease CtpA/Prc